MNEIMSRQQAISQGLKHFFTGKPCRNGHISWRYVDSYSCSICASIKSLRSQAKRPEHPMRIEARERGEIHYSVGESCKHGHEDKKFVANGICVQCAAARCKKYFDERPGLEAKLARERRAKDPTGHREASKRWAKKNPEAHSALRDRCIAKNRELWRKRWVCYVQNRNARKRKNGGSFTAHDIEEIRKKQCRRCNGCQKDGLKLQIDHIKAVVNGGSSNPVNLQLLCGTCNKSKGRKDFDEWLNEQNFDLSS